jgi:hypothetical protein
MAARFVATSVNVVKIDDDVTAENAQNARIRYDTDSSKGWTISGDSTLGDGTELRRAVLDPADKSSATDAYDADVGVEFAYVAAQSRSVKKVNGNDTTARIVFSPASL